MNKEIFLTTCVGIAWHFPSHMCIVGIVGISPDCRVGRRLVTVGKQPLYSLLYSVTPTMPPYKYKYKYKIQQVSLHHIITKHTLYPLSSVPVIWLPSSSSLSSPSLSHHYLCACPTNSLGANAAPTM